MQRHQQMSLSQNICFLLSTLLHQFSHSLTHLSKKGLFSHDLLSHLHIIKLIFFIFCCLHC
ncbi:hypothetical protein I7I48_11317 [Histoplasma ohiense]|nr:hypothetical protein I7I48_11317 [Histoplasma ohiense (nom. inval.)]